MRMRNILWCIRLIMIGTYFIFSFIPLLLTSSLLFLPFLSSYLTLYFFSIILFIIFGLIAIYGIISLKLKLRPLITVFFSSGLLLYLQNPYLLVLGFTLSWFFYKIWHIAFKYNQLDREYSTYPSNSIENKKLMKTFQGQFNSFILLVWTILSISWGILLVTNLFYVDLGTGEFGTLGISISITIILLVRFIRNYFDSNSNSKQKLVS
ncbi:MAG: hypothetical protein ACFFFH_09795 [Candidatus Thorarchaeota archaeon]